VHQLPSLFAVDSESTRQANKTHGRKLAQKGLTEEKHAEMEAIVHHHRDHHE